MSEEVGSDTASHDGPASRSGAPARPARRRSAAQQQDALEQRRLDAELLSRIRWEHDRRHRAAKAMAKRTGTTPEPIEACPEYQVLSSRLVRYAIPTIKSLLRTGRIKEALLDRDLPHILHADDYERLHTSMEARDGLAVTTVIAGEYRFRNTTITQGAWAPDKGAKLETYFVTGCLFDFQAAVREWRKEHPQWSTLGRQIRAKGVLLEDLAPQDLPDVADSVTERDQLERALRTAPPLVRQIAGLLLEEDLSYVEIGERLGFSARAVEGQLYRFRSQLRRAGPIRRLTPLVTGQAGAA